MRSAVVCGHIVKLGNVDFRNERPGPDITKRPQTTVERIRHEGLNDELQHDRLHVCRDPIRFRC